MRFERKKNFTWIEERSRRVEAQPSIEIVSSDRRLITWIVNESQLWLS